MADVRASSRSLGRHPEKIGRYHIQRCIGRGAMGVVYEAQDEVMGRRVGLKVLMADLEGDPETLARFHREAQAAARLVHRNIITIFDAGEDQGRSFIAMQLLEGWPLAQYMARPEAAPLERKLDLMIQICEGLTAAHGQGVIHRDLKPNNLFVQTDGLLKIYDFGVARLAESTITAVGTMIGTPDYMSPEQARGDQVDARSDIFSAGAVFYFILAGHKPFPGPDLPAVLHQLQFDRPSLLASSAAPPELESLVLRAMAKDPAERPPRIEELLAGLVRFRRQYEAETRRLTATVRARFDVIEKVAEAINTEAASLALPDDRGVGLTPAERFPVAASRDGVGLESIATDRAQITALLHEIDAERQRLTALLEGRRTRAAQIEEGRRLLSSGDAVGALRLFELVVAACPDASIPRELANECRPLARQQEAEQQHLTELTAAARRAIDSTDLATAIALCEEALSLRPHHELAAALLAEAHQTAAREQRRQARWLQRVLDRVALAIDGAEFSAAHAALKEAELLKPEAPEVDDLRRRLTEAEVAAEAALLLQQSIAEEIRQARAAFRRGRYDEAVLQLRAFLDAEPEASEVAAELSHLVRLRERLAAASSTRQAKSSALLAAARPLADRLQFAEAVALLHEALRVNPVDLEAAALLDHVMERDLQHQLSFIRARITANREAEATPLIEVAREALARGYLAIALDAAGAACRIAPDRTEATSLAAEIRAVMAVDDVGSATLAEVPLPEPSPEPRPKTAEPERRSEPGVLSQVNEWAAGLLRRRSRKS